MKIDLGRNDTKMQKALMKKRKTEEVGAKKNTLQNMQMNIHPDVTMVMHLSHREKKCRKVQVLCGLKTQSLSSERLI